jgi:hypothetical protein
MQLTDFKWMTKRLGQNDPTENAGAQIVLDFGKYHLSIIDDGYGREDHLLEIGLFEAADGVATTMTELPGITAEGDTVQGHLTEADVDCIIMKLFSITGTMPTQI